MDTEGALAIAELSVQTEPLASNTNAQTISDSTTSPSTYLQVSQADTKENQAATVIQSAFRSFLVLFLSLVTVSLLTIRNKSMENIVFCNVLKQKHGKYCIL